MFSSMKMEEYMESELSGIFREELMDQNIVIGFQRTQLRAVSAVCDISF